MEQQLSKDAQAVVEAFLRLSTIEKGTVVAVASTVLAAEIAQKVSTAIPEKLAKASSQIDQGIKTATHGFKQGTAPDDTAAIEVKIRRPTGEEVTCLFSEEARGKLYEQLATYGKNDLKGATLLTHDDFKAVVDSLYNAIRGYKVVKYALQTEDQALQQAYKIVTDGVRRDGGFSWAAFALDDGGAVVDRSVSVGGFLIDSYYRNHCAAFVCPPAESK